jgi:hypothetical protein
VRKRTGRPFVTALGYFETYTRTRVPDLGSALPVLKPASPEQILNAIARACF